jgi:Relaxase/Mobilisation nuclease domain
MIVKRVATKRSVAPKSRALHARDLCDYIAGPNAGDKDELVEHPGALNFLNIDHEAQVAEMCELAETARGSAQQIHHWILSWRQGEQPTASQADGAVRMFIGELGLADHQAIYALHRDTDNFHLRLAINRVHPESERVVTVNRGFDLEIAHRAIARIEHVQGWEREANGRYQVVQHGDLGRAPIADAAPRQPSPRARDLEIQSGDKSAQRKAIEEAAEVLRKRAIGGISTRCTPSWRCGSSKREVARSSGWATSR